MEEKSLNDKGLSIMYTNADSLMNKREELNMLINSCQQKPNIIAITEVKNKRNIKFELTELNIPGYSLYTNDFEKNSRGLLFYVENCLNVAIVDCDVEYVEYLVISSSSSRFVIQTT